MDESSQQQPAPLLRILRVEIEPAGDDVLLRLWQRPGVETRVTAAQLERWVMRQMREQVFA